MEIIDLKKYLTPFEIEKKRSDLNVALYSADIINGTGFYNTIFKREINSLYKRIYTITRENKIISVVTSIIPQKLISSVEYDDLEKQIDNKKNVVSFDNDIMLTWPSNDEKKLLANNKTSLNLQILLRKTLFITNKQEIVRYEEDAMLPGYYSLQK